MIKKRGFTPLEKFTIQNKEDIYNDVRERSKCSLTGFTLLELICAVAILVVALVGLLSSYTGSLNLIQANTNTSIAVNEAQRIIEEMRKRNLRANIVSEDWPAWVISEGCNCLSNESINVTYPDGTDADPLQILVRVNWTEKGRARNVELVTLLTER
ncbi:MAG: type II secretion system protein [Candidatus Omnitrophica bacterium]|nr:type II secretion system protein [Candidatus Omnitrophota bacterium]